MPIFVLVPKTPGDREAVKPRVEKEFGEKERLLMPSGSWLVSAAGTSEDIAHRLGITGVPRGPSAIVFTITGYFGRAPSNVWEWLKEKMEEGSRA